MLIVDMFTDKTGRKKNQKAMKKGKKDTDHSIE